jgi:hypothetical protein
MKHVSALFAFLALSISAFAHVQPSPKKSFTILGDGTTQVRLFYARSSNVQK